MRHSFVSLLTESGPNIEKISLLVGHKSTQVTETVYRHQPQQGCVGLNDMTSRGLQISLRGRRNRSRLD
jgi:integrase